MNKNDGVNMALEAIECWKEGKLSAYSTLLAIEIALKNHTEEYKKCCCLSSKKNKK